MLSKVAVLGVLAVAAPLFWTQEPIAGDADAVAGPAVDAVDASSAQREELAAAHARIEDLQRQLGECLDMLQAEGAPSRSPNCSPSRGQRRSLLTHYQWLRRNGHAERAATTLARLTEDLGNDVGRINDTAWHLLTDDETAGKFDDVALALCEHMETLDGDLPHQVRDTCALAKFLGGKIDDAIALQRAALAQNPHSDDYKRRLRTYEAARHAVATTATPTDAPVVAERSLHE